MYLVLLISVIIIIVFIFCVFVFVKQSNFLRCLKKAKINKTKQKKRLKKNNNRTITSFMFYVSALRILIITLASDKFVIFVLIFRENKVLTSPQMIYMKYQIVFSQKKLRKIF